MGEYSEAEKQFMQRVAEQEKEHLELSVHNIRDGKIPQQFDFTTEEGIAEEIAEQIESLVRRSLSY